MSERVHHAAAWNSSRTEPTAPRAPLACSTLKLGLWRAGSYHCAFDMQPPHQSGELSHGFLTLHMNLSEKRGIILFFRSASKCVWKLSARHSHGIRFNNVHYSPVLLLPHKVPQTQGATMIWGGCSAPAYALLDEVKSSVFVQLSAPSCLGKRWISSSWHR